MKKWQNDVMISPLNKTASASKSARFLVASSDS